MDTNGLSDVTALLFGTGIIIAFSYERFNRVSYDTSRRLERLVSFLTPDKMRARQKVGYAYFIYTLALVMTYLVLCAYGSVLLPLIGADGLLPTVDVGASGLPNTPIPGPVDVSDSHTGYFPMDTSTISAWIQGLIPTPAPDLPPSDSSDIGIPAEVSMGLALVMIGVAPAVPALARADEWLRTVAHRMAGIPTWAIEASDSLRANATSLGLGIYRGDEAVRSRAADYLGSASDLSVLDKFPEKEKNLGNFDDFCLNLEIILVASAWFSEERLYVSAAGDQLRFKDLEKELRRRKTTLIHSLKTGVGSTDWDLLVSDADALASDFCILIALYNELEVIQPYRDRPIGSPSQRKALKQLKDFVQILNNDTEPRMRQRFSNLALFWTLGLVMFWTVIWAVLWPGAAEYELQRNAADSDPYQRLLSYSVTAFNSYGIAIIVAITLRWVRTLGDPEDSISKWVNMYRPKSWTRWLPQAFLVLFLAWAMSTAVTLALQVWSTGLLEDKKFDLNFWPFLSTAFEYNAPLCFRGAVLALLVLILLDARQDLGLRSHRATKLKPQTDPQAAKELRAASETWRDLSRRDSWQWAALGFTVMAAVTIVTRYLTFLAGRGSSTRPFDNIDAGLMIWAVLYASILGALVLFCLSEVFTRQTFRSTSRDTPDPSAKPDPPDAKPVGIPLSEEVAK